jgi:uncharacterized membrane protein YebE (DUF533 family)
MNTSGFLDQLLQSAKGLMSDTRERVDTASDRIENEGIGGFKLGKLAQGAIAGGALSLLLGSRGGRKLATYGGLAALGTLAYRAWRDHQRGTASSGNVEPRTVDRLSGPEVELHSRGILVALIAAAKADGHIDDRERALIQDEIGKLSQDTGLQTWIANELAQPLDPARVAASATTPELASEMYLASLLVADEQSFMERAYLEELATQLKLESTFKARLEKQVQGQS